MDNSILKRRILMEMNNLIDESCAKQQSPLDYEQLHKAILQNHYHATCVEIDYHRRRVTLDIVMNDQNYDPTTINLYMPTLHTNLWYRNLTDFLKSCIDSDPKSIAFYAYLIRKQTNVNILHRTA